MSQYEVFLYLHLVGVFLLVGAAGFSTVAGIVVTRSDDARTARTFLLIQRSVERMGTIPGALIVIIFGTLLVDEAGFEFSDGWISAAYLLWIVDAVLGSHFLLRLNRRMVARLDALGARGVTTGPEVRRVTADRAMTALGMLVNATFFVFLYLMVAKPGA